MTTTTSMMPPSALDQLEQLRRRLKRDGHSMLANSCIADALDDEDRSVIRRAVQVHVERMLRALLIDTVTDHNTRGTAERIARMYVDEVFAGRYRAAPSVTDFPNAKKLDQLYSVGPIAVRSTCSHHFAPIIGKAWIGVIPGKRVVGLSKFSRLTRWVMSRPQIQEEAVVQLADEIERRIKPRGLAVVIKAQHTCMTWRGVTESGTMMTTSVMRGAMRFNVAARAEFLKLIEEG